MNDEQFRKNIQLIHQQMAILYGDMMRSPVPPQMQSAEALEEIAAALGNLQLIYEEMQTSIEASADVEEGLFQQNQQFIVQRQYYYHLFQFCPEPYLMTDADGLILEANAAIATLLNVPQKYLIRRPLAVFVAQSDRQAFRTFLNQLSSVSDAQNWEMNLCPKQGEPFAAQLKVALVRDDAGVIEALRISVHEMSQYGQIAQNAQLRVSETTPQEFHQDVQAQTISLSPSLPQPLDGLQVLVVEDEADAREFITAVLESHGIRVTAVENVAAALETLEQFHPDVLVSDIRMPHEDGYSLIRKVRELEAQKGWHIPAAALTSYLEEDRAKALAAGFESHLHKLAQPTELIEMVTRLAGRDIRGARD